ncbi:MAG: nickel-dependent lactate racemase [Deltaproteobacteria bacterium]|jgi:nickel-dependent lactate racemase|nr:nickel-dependent lactate racemase [Deltaproteobacteria bacterium]
MAEVTIPFDGKPHRFQVPDRNLAEVLSPKPYPTIAAVETEIEHSLDHPIHQAPLETAVKPTDRVLLVSDDNTRSTPVDHMIPALLRRLNRAGVPDHRIACLIALGTHRYMTEQEIVAKVGPAVFKRIRVLNHEWRNPDVLVDLGTSSRGTPLQVNRLVAEADVVIGLGAIVPHHIPGFSGSSKIIQPGVCGAITTAETHMLSCESGGDSFLGYEDNPVRQDMDDMADKVGMNTIFNVVMDTNGRVAGFFFGEMRAVFREGVRLARKIYGVPYHETPDIVLANSCPCDLDFWQSHKSQYPAQRMVKPGGTIIICTPAPEGVSPVHTELLNFTSWPSDRIKAAYRRGELKNGVACALAVAWAMVREKASVITFSPGIPAEHKAKLGHTHAPSIEWAIEEALRRQGTSARLTVLTHSPDLLPLGPETAKGSSC